MTPEHEPFTPVSEIGEFGLIDRMASTVPTSAGSVLLGIGDDAAAIASIGSSVILITTDALIEHVHFDRTYTPMRHLGYKSIAVNVSDIAAMNGTPTVATVALGLPNNVSVQMVDALYAGIQDACEDVGLSIVGGDTCASQKLVLSITVLGECDRDHLTKRSGAEPGDLLCATGTLGASYAGLRILQFHKQRMVEEDDEYQPDLSPYGSVVERHLRPRPRLDIVRAMRDRQLVPKAMIDLSDGLSSDVRHLCKASACGVDIDIEHLPIAEETRTVATLLQDSVQQYALRGGEDYELLFAVDASDEDALSEIEDVHIIGRLTQSDRGLKVTQNGHTEDMDDQASFRHF